MTFRKLFPATVWLWRKLWLSRFATALCVVLFIAVVLLLAQRWHAEGESRQLLHALALLDIGKSSSTDVEQIQQRFPSYWVPNEQPGTLQTVSFTITNQPIPRLKIGPG